MAHEDLNLPVAFTGRRRELFWLLLRGYVLMLPTLGLYRFWVTTAKRRYYWQHTVVAGESLEYTGTALQLLVGFLFALAFFLPIYGLFFYLSTQSPMVSLVGYGVVAVVLWFLAGYAIYRGRDFRLSRTLWRGIRFDQQGSAWRYALRRFLWSLLVLVTLGLAYPFMAADLWRYRYAHTYYGDRAFRFSGSWKTIARPFYTLYALVAVLVVLIVVNIGNSLGTPIGSVATSPWTAALGFLLILVAGGGYFYYQARETSRMFSAVELGAARLTVRVRARALFGQYVLYGLAVLGASLVLLLIGGLIYAAILGGSAGGLGEFNPATLAGSGLAGIVAAILGYLAFVATYALMGEVFIGYGFWMLVARGAVISHAESLDTVRAADEDHSVVGEGLADALNVGSY